VAAVNLVTMRTGDMIASGRDCFVFESGPGKVVRRARDGRSLEREASVMRHARRHGFPAPEVFDAEGPDILMERIDGPSMMQDVARRPWRLRAHARLLAELHRQLAAIRAPGWLPAAEGCIGNSLLHLDLHPLNVLITPDGPRVIDWATACRGPAAADVANTWLTMATVPVSGPVPRAGRHLMLRTFLEGVDREAARPYLIAMAERRSGDRNTLDAERINIERLVAREAHPAVASARPANQ
jgi:aminoglycoside phosphotransferase (APT) family kinase protein